MSAQSATKLEAIGGSDWPAEVHPRSSSKWPEAAGAEARALANTVKTGGVGLEKDAGAEFTEPKYAAKTLLLLQGDPVATGAFEYCSSL